MGHGQSYVLLKTCPLNFWTFCMAIARQANGQKSPILGMNHCVPKTWQKQPESCLNVYLQTLEPSKKMSTFLIRTLIPIQEKKNMGHGQSYVLLKTGLSVEL